MPERIKWTDGSGCTVLTRNEVIRLWQDSRPEILDSYCCPSCRDILYKNEEGLFYCGNPFCPMPDADGKSLKPKVVK